MCGRRCLGAQGGGPYEGSPDAGPPDAEGF